MTSQLVRETKLILNKLAGMVQRLSVVWIKAHFGHEGNKAADRLAKLGTTNGEKRIQVGTPQAEIKSDISKYVRNLWDEELQTYGVGKHTKEFYTCLLYTSPSPRDLSTSRMPSSA